jgi:integrase
MHGELREVCRPRDPAAVRVHARDVYFVGIVAALAVGKVRRYLRRPGSPRVALHGDPDSLSFIQRYNAAIAGIVTRRPRQKAPDSVSVVVADFYKSAGFTNLKPSSQRVYRLVLDALAQKHGQRSVKDMPTHAARKMIEAIGETRPGMANLTHAVMHKFMAYVIKGGWRIDNPVSSVDKYKLGSVHCWTDAELRAYEKRWPRGTRQRLAYALLLYTDQRVGDVARMRRRNICDGMIHLVQEKTGKALAIPIHPALDRALKAGPVLGMQLIGDKHGRPMQAKALSRLIIKAAAAAGLPGECRAHGLRKALQRLLAEHGASTKELQAVSGHASLEESERYTRAAEQARLARAAMMRLPDEA